MTLQEFRKLSKRDFDNGAVTDDIEKMFEDRDRALAACEAYIRWEEAEKGNFSPRECVALLIEAERLARAAIFKSKGGSDG